MHHPISTFSKMKSLLEMRANVKGSFKQIIKRLVECSLPSVAAKLLLFERNRLKIFYKS